MRSCLDKIVREWRPLTHDAALAARYRVTLNNGCRATLGLITAMSCPFCDCCDRIRIAADGSFFPCLMDCPACSLLPALRPRFDAAVLDDQLAQGLCHKTREHPAVGIAVMTDIGG